MDALGKPVGVIVTRHAADRFRERHAPCEMNVISFMVKEIHDALTEHRGSPRMPIWTSQSGERLRNQHGTFRFVWNAAETRCYVIRKADGDESRRDEFSKTWIVLTTLARMSDEQIEEASQLVRAEKQRLKEDKGPGRGRANANRNGRNRRR